MEVKREWNRDYGELYSKLVSILVLMEVKRELIVIIQYPDHSEFQSLF